ncbi:MAG TPA: alkaline phosphatase family protein [Thermoanaerobaculia bacterium]|jgi:predicted AlkP superfamily phosphohydrolase/phosphomutase/Tfp pilus assembly protein PilF
MRRRRIGFLPLILVFAACGRSESAPPSPEKKTSAGAGAPAVVEASDTETRTRRAPGGRPPVFWIGLDGLDWELLDRLAAEGRMPNWKRLTAEGWSGVLESEYPLISPILWTTAATGVPPDVHRVLDFQETDPKTGAKNPISGFSRAVPAVWNEASAGGRKVGVVGWWATHPAEEVDGFFVSDRASPILFSGLPLAGAAYPVSLETAVAQVLARDGKVSADDLAPYLDAASSDVAAALGSGAGMENRIVALSRVVAATRVTQRLARDLYDRQLPDLLAVYFEGTDEVGHVFAPFTPPRPDCPAVSDEDFGKYRRVVGAYYNLVDRLLGQWMRRAEEDGATLLVHSDHGFKWGADRPCGLASGNWATAAFWHRPQGVIAAWGKGVRRSADRGRARILDVAPTVLALLGLPADRTMPGAPVTGAFDGLAPPPRADVYSKIAVRRLPAASMSASESSEYAKKLLALGYLSPAQARPLAPAGGDRPGMTEGAWNNLGMYYLETRHDPTDARKAFEKSLALRPDYYSPIYNLALLSRQKGDTRAAEDWLFKALAMTSASSDPAVAVGGWARDYDKAGNSAAARSLLDRAAKTWPGNEGIARDRAIFLYRNKDCRGAVAALSPFEGTTTTPQTLNALAIFETCLADRAAVERLLAKSLALNPNQPDVARSLARVRQKD